MKMSNTLLILIKHKDKETITIIIRITNSRNAHIISITKDNIRSIKIGNSNTKLVILNQFNPISQKEYKYKPSLNNKILILKIINHFQGSKKILIIFQWEILLDKKTQM